MTPIDANLNHVLRIPLAAEIHSRPFLTLEGPQLISHLAVFRSQDGAPRSANMATQHATLANLCRLFNVAAPAPDANHFYHDFGRFRLKWECHTEFATYTFAEHMPMALPPEEAFANMPVRWLPSHWLASLEGKIMVAAHVLLDRSDLDVNVYARTMQELFAGNVLVGSQVMQGGELWADFTIRADGFSRFIIRDVGMRAQQAGRLVQRVLEIETYRMMALLGLPHAQKTAAELNLIESELVTLATAMVETDAAPSGKPVTHDGAAEQALLDQITRLAARIEKLSLENNFRFSASNAYFSLVNARIEELREVRMEGLPMVEEFMDRRLTPAMHTCTAMARRQEALAQRVANTNDLLRTRVGIVQELQSRQILLSMNARAAQQLRLQQSVEGLSVAAISYYVIGLLSYAGKAAKDAGLIAHADLFIGLFVPVVAVGVWFGLKKMHARVQEE
jgi:uncharacterized membrane-anchored protein